MGPSDAPAAAAAALARMGLAAHSPFPAKILSHGQKRRLGLARLLMAQRPLWILDEPFTALDTGSCRLLNELIAEQLAHGGLVVLASHQDPDTAGGAIRRLDLDALRAVPHRPVTAAGVGTVNRQLA